MAIPIRNRRNPTARVTEKLYKPLNEGQRIVWESQAQTTAAISGHFGGKSHLGAYWTLDQAYQNPGCDGIICGTNFKTLNNSAIPKLRSLFTLNGLPWEFDQHRKLGFRQSSYEYWLPKGGVLYIRSADRPGSMQGAHAKFYWMDETVDTTFYVYETLIGRIAGMGGRGLITSTPYDRGWLYDSIYKPWIAEGSPQGEAGTELCVAQWTSIENPAFSEVRWAQLKRQLPEWRFRMLYEGQFERPMGLVYDCLQDKHFCTPFEIPPTWPRILGLDFGFTDPTACLWLAKAPDGKIFAYDEFYQTGWMRWEAIENEAREKGMKSQGAQSMRLEMIDEIVERCRSRHENVTAVYCDHDPDLHRYAKDKFFDEMGFDNVYMAAKGPGSILSGIERNYVLAKQDNFYIFNTLKNFKDESDSYSWKVDDKTGEVKKDEPKPGKDHLMDAWRYATAGSPDEKTNSFGFGKLNPYSPFGLRDYL